MKSHFASTLFLLVLSSWLYGQNKAPNQKPNVLVILTDDQGYFDVGAMGASDLLTPHMDDLFAKGMRFGHFYANSPVCSPTRASLLTGRYPDQAGVPGVIRTSPDNSWGYLNPEATTLADKFKAGGYKTAIIGKWHLGTEKPNIPNLRGFDFFKGFLGDMMDDYYTHRRHGLNYMRENEKTIDPQGHATELFSQWAVEYLEAQKDGQQPFFLYLAYNAPHTPVQAPQEWLAKTKARQPKLNDQRARLVAFIEHLDAGVGQVIDKLRSSGLYDNTIIVFSSDNGGLLSSGANNGPLRDGKQSVYEGGLRVPTAIVWNGKVKPGMVSNYKAMTMDLYPTLLEAAGIAIGHHIDGRSFLPELQGQKMDDSKRVLYFTRREGGHTYGGLTIQAIQQNNWKLVQNSPFESPELYNLAEDPYETFNLIVSEPDQYHLLNELMMKQIQRGGRVPWQKP
ncbi:MAG: sulfatase-like hydrolase/transferase [Cyclobacteriaceae bacterium]|nr:sulfatase-like hydrolase/transferase [Cyclobacteriaceae bacterium]